MLPADRHARRDQRDRADKIEPALAAEPTEKMEATEATEPIDRTDPAEPILRIEPAEPMDKIDPLDPILRSEPAATATAPAGDIDAAAVAAYRVSVREGRPLSERKLAPAFGRTSRRWARNRMAEAGQGPAAG